MKIIISIALCFFAAVAEDIPDGKRNTLRVMSKECAEQVGASPDDVEAMIDNKEEMTKEGKCLQACVMKKFNMMTEAGELKITGEAVSKKQYAMACISASDGDDECVKAYKYLQCMTNEAKADEV